MDDATSEEWRAVVDYEGLYLASDLGRIRSLPRNTTSGRIMKLIPDKRGYLYVTLTKNGKQARRPVHQLVAEAFAGAPEPGQEVRHLDGNPANNRWAPGSTEEEIRSAGGNLFYGTHVQNMADMIEHGTVWQLNVTRCPQGHEYTEANTWRSPSRPNARWCRQCIREHGAASYQRRKEEGSATWVPSADLPPEKLERRRALARERMARYRKRQRLVSTLP